jgi:hypothetical protein
MLYVIYALLGFLLLRYALKAFARANPALLARRLRRAGGFAALFGALAMLTRGQIYFAIGLGTIAASLLGAFSQWQSGGAFRNAGQKGGVSRVRSAMIEMELDHETGSMQGVVLAGKHEGMKLDDLTRAQCDQLYRACLADDQDGARLLEAYMDRRFAGWRQAGNGDRDAGSRHARRRQPGAMTEDEAYEVLGLQKGATSEEVARAHRTLMKKFHPDHGGSTDLAARVNEAKDVLMRRHQ